MPDADRATFARESAWLADTLREAGAIACKLFRTDLKHWTPAGTFSAGPVAAFARDPGTHGSTVRFYRAVQVP